MKKISILILLFCISISLYSQINYLNKLYNPNNTSSSAINICSNNTGYAISAIVVDSLLFKYNIALIKIDTIGNIILRKDYKLDSADYYIGCPGGGGFSRCKSEGYILSGNIVLGYRNKIFLMRLDNNFDTIWSKIIYDDTVFMTLRQCVETKDHGYALCGEKKVYNQINSLTNAFIIKTDSLGNIQYEKLYNITGGHNGEKCDGAYNITQTADNGFLLGCDTYNNFLQGTGDPVVIKTDSIGNVKWVKNFGSNEKELFATTTICNDSNYLVASILSIYTSIGNDVWRAKIHLTKLRPDGSIIWEKIYEPETVFLTIYNIVELDDGDIVLSGIKEQIIGNESYLITYLFKVNFIGDSIWYRDIYKDVNLPTLPVINYTYYIEPTNDGGIIGCGEVLKMNYIPQSIWVFKTDSLGCLQPGCQYVGVDELHKAKGELQIFPNPAITQATISYQVADNAIMIQIYNMLGQIVYEEKLPKGSSQTTIDTRAFKPGLYKVVVGESSGTLLITN